MRALVTGANGHLGYNLVQALLAAGHRTRASVRTLDDPSKTARLRALGNVELVEAKLERPAQLRAAMNGIECLFHAAATYVYVSAGREQEILDDSIRGADAAVNAAADAGVRKIVFTSSLVTLPLTRRDAPPADETQWTDDLAVPYIRAKTEGERVAWRVARARGIDLVAILPGALTGPGFVRNTPSLDIIEMMMRGGLRAGVPDFNYPIVDVRDVTRAHLLAAELDCEGRFAVCNDTLPSFRTMLETMHAIDPSIPLPWMSIPDFAVGALPLFDRLNERTLRTPRTLTREMLGTFRGKVWNASNRRAREVLGWRPEISLEQTLRDTIDAMRARDRSKAVAQPA
ncbi:MAG: NAD-dependent epimerase/dehydratase family protein [Burkholderiaceae bacterium]|nr:NAD-dependent epimerase/dehydratase family protein [Burkholderiaceae bacterium]